MNYLLQLLAVEKKLATVSAEYRSDICLKMEENKSLTMMLDMMRSKQLGRVNSSEDESSSGKRSDGSESRGVTDKTTAAMTTPVSSSASITASSTTRTLDGSASDGASMKDRHLPDPNSSPAAEVIGWSSERRQLELESGTPTTPTPTSSSCCSSGKVTRNVR